MFIFSWSPYSTSYKQRNENLSQQFIWTDIKAILSKYFLPHDLNATTYYEYWQSM